MVRKATEADLEQLISFRCRVFGGTRQAAKGWLQNIAGIENLLLVTGKDDDIAAMIGVVPVEMVHHHGILLCGMATAEPYRRHALMTRLVESCLGAYGEKGASFAVVAPGNTATAKLLAKTGMQAAFPVRVIEKTVAHNLWAQADFDNLTVKRLTEMRQHYQPGCILLPPEAAAESMTQLYAKGITVVSNARGYGLYFTHGDVLQFVELQAENDHSADVLLEAAREKTGAGKAQIVLADRQTLYLGAGKKCGYGMLKMLGEPFATEDAYFRLMLGE